MTTAAIYLRVSTNRQAEHDLSIPDQRRQAEKFCQARGWSIISEFVEAGASATTADRPQFQRMMDAVTSGRADFDTIVVHSFSRFFRDHFELEFSIRRMAKHGVKLVSLTQDIGDDPSHVMIRQIMSLFDEYQSKENAKHTLRAMKENALQGFWNGSRPPLGFRVIDAEQRGQKTKKRLEIDPVEARIVERIYDLYLNGDGANPSPGVKLIARRLNEDGLRTRTGGRFGVKSVHDVLIDTVYAGRYRFNQRDSKTGALKAEDQVVEAAVPAIVDQKRFDEVQRILRSRNPRIMPTRVVTGPILLTGLTFCATCGGAMTLRTGKSGRYRYYTCCSAARIGATACKGRSVPMNKLDELVVEHLADRICEPQRIKALLGAVLEQRDSENQKRDRLQSELQRQKDDINSRLGRLYSAIESGVADLADGALKDRIDTLRRERDGARASLDRIEKSRIAGQEARLTPEKVEAFSSALREKLRDPRVNYRKAYIRLITDRIEVDDTEVRVFGRQTKLLAAVTSNLGDTENTVPSSVRSWRPLGDSNPCYRRERAVS
jgi:site-specific DNA recombinase